MVIFVILIIEEEDEDVIVGEAVDGDGNPIKLQRVMLEELNQEVLMDEEKNLYDMEGNYLGKLDDDAEEDQNNDKKSHENMDLPEIPP